MPPAVRTPRVAVDPTEVVLLLSLRSKPPSARFSVSVALVNRMSLEEPPLTRSMSVVVVPDGRSNDALAWALMFVMLPATKMPESGTTFVVLISCQRYGV